MCDCKGLVFRLNDHGQGPELIRQVFLERGWTEFDEDTHEEYEFNLWWRTSRFKTSEYDQLYSWQRFNHYPKSTGITKKDSLARNLKRMRGVHGAGTFNFSPIAFNLPNDYTRFVSEYTKQKDKDPDKAQYWICKPADLSRGRGIFIFKDLSELQYDCNAVVQKYISNPLLISGYKFDLRIYVVVPSFHPLHIYIYQEGLVRFSTEKFDLNSLGNMYAHLTNTSINKHSPSYTSEKERVGAGCKWTLTQLRYYFHQNNLDDHLLWTRIINIVILTILTQASQVPRVSNCFELYGFDIIIDKNMKPWLLEVNFSPALSSDCQTDQIVKKPMLNDIFNILNYKDIDKERGGEEFHQLHQRKKLSKPARNLSTTAKALQRPVIGRLPNIQCASRQSSNNSYVEGESDEENITPTVAGCGLPTVQNPSYSSKRKHSSESSGCSSAGSSRSDLSSKIASSPDKDAQSPCSSVKNCDNKNPSKQGDSKGKALHKINEGQAEDNETIGDYHSPTIDSPLFHKSTTLPFEHRSSADLVNSNTNNSSKSTNTNGATPRKQELKGHKRKTIGLLRPVRTWKTRESQEELSAVHLSGSGNGSHSNSIGSNPLLQNPVAVLGNQGNLGLSQRSTETVDMQDDNTENLHPGPLDSDSQKPYTAREMKELFSSRRKSVSFPANPLLAKPHVIRRSSATSLASLPARKTYPRPWRRTKTSTHTPPQTVNKTLRSQIGDFILALPFNDVTRKAVASTLDEKTVIRECQKFLKSQQEMRKQGESGSLTKVKADQVIDTPQLWGPITDSIDAVVGHSQSTD